MADYNGISDTDLQKYASSIKARGYSDADVAKRVAYAKYWLSTQANNEQVVRFKELLNQKGYDPSGKYDGYNSGQYAPLLDAFNQSSDNEVADWEKGRKAEADAEAKKQQEDAQRSSLNAKLQEYVRGLQGELDPNSKQVQALQSLGTDAGQKAYSSAGWGQGGSALGRLSNAATQRLLIPYQQQREAALGNAMGLLSQRDVSLGQLSQGEEQLRMQRQKMAQEQAMANFAADQNQGAGIGSAIGTGLGALGTAALGFIPGIGPAAALAAAPALMGGGAKLFGGIGSSIPRWRGGRGYGGGGGVY